MFDPFDTFDTITARRPAEAAPENDHPRRRFTPAPLTKPTTDQPTKAGKRLAN
jgi:hypothetical protein